MMKKVSFPRLGENCWFERLENGLPIYVVTKPDFEKSYAFFATSYGGMDMRYQLDGQWLDTPAGVAHYLEHKMFDTPEGNALTELSANGASPNAFTSSHITGYYFSCTEHFLANLRTLLSFVSVPYFTPESVEKEQGIIGQEIRMVEDNPDWRMFNNLLKGLYHTNPIRVSVAGTQESISHITAETLYHCHKAFYHPSNMVLCVAGDVDPEKVAAIARMVLPSDWREPPVKDHGGEEDMQADSPRITEHMEVATPKFLIGLKSEAHPNGEENLRLQLIGDMAGDLLCGTSSPLYKRLYEKGLINKSYFISYEDYPGAAFLVMGGESPDPEQVAQAVLEEGKRIQREGIPEERFQRCKKACYGSRVRALNSFEHCCTQLAEGNFKGYHYYQFPELYDSLTKEDVLPFLNRLVAPERMTMSQILPK
jgi:predicted Zn-dependent peptidase